MLRSPCLHRAVAAAVVCAALAATGPACAADGALDATFGLFGAVEVPASGMRNTLPVRATLDTQGNILGCADVGSTPIRPWLYRRTPSGAVDTDFGSGGALTVSLPAGATDLDCSGFAAAADGRVWLASTGGANVYVLRRLPDGSPDATFAGVGVLALPRDQFDFVTDMALRPDGSAIVAGVRITATGWRFSLFHVLANGQLDTGFGNGGYMVFDGFSAFRSSSRDDEAKRVLLAADGAIFVIGTLKPTAGNTDFAAAKFTAQGQIDNTFGVSGAVTVAFDLGQGNNDRVDAGAVDARGRLLLAGTVERSAAGDSDVGVARLLPTGALDTTFGSAGKRTIAFDLGGAGADGALDMRLQSDGRVLLAGFATHVSGNGNTDWALARLLPSGSLDGSFGSGGKAVFAWDLGGGNYDTAGAVLLSGGRPLVVGVSDTGSNTAELVLGRLQNDLIFADPLGG